MPIVKSSAVSKPNLVANDKALFVTPITPKFSFNDLILSDKIESQIFDLLSSRENQDKVFSLWGFNQTHKHQSKIALNLYGAPGTGKTMAAHAIANELGQNIIEVNYADIESKYVGDTPKNLQKVFEAATETNSVLFFDEADAMLSRRVTNMSNSTDTSVNQTRSVLLVLLNNFKGTIIFATNFISNYDPAFMRRILGHVHFTLPDQKERVKIWTKLIPKSFPNSLDTMKIAEDYSEISGSDISNAILKVAFRTAKENLSCAPHSYFEESINQIIKSKDDNSVVSVTSKKVSEQYALKQLNNEGKK
ncbi:ATP-binding protein [Vibrio metschnikovii]|uniref:ATP-binding protein n=1 Tax=Vibrio metschnikovii TaxID=28172 RepID=UPI001C2F497E|nr:AAA family ATPase [Vibrio metschnikovii]EKO3611799.1 ATP-binding protein [Vibrio metschnikovii]EKO3615426.1 ATP-binding protein [Vibrio metschnikovii]EKO3636322.1 ATP-binding protein [Vibrio metschnikovii]EKO3653379.1 ATP-binding protein [Vibrio metschnikovii]EKO3684605.1 ATP-binding protein [Vibrio metschnikovii]